jgi:hypothetical protein
MGIKEFFKKYLKNKTTPDEKYQKLMSSIKILKEEEKELKRSVGYLKRKKADEDIKLIPFAFSVLVAAAIGGLLNTFSTSIELIDNDVWVTASAITIFLTIVFIGYIFEKFPNNWISFLKTIVVSFSAMTTFSLIRFYHFFNEYTNPKSEIKGFLTVSYNIFLFLLFLIGILLIFHSILERKNVNKRNVLGTVGCGFLLIVPVLMFIIGPNFGG